MSNGSGRHRCHIMNGENLESMEELMSGNGWVSAGRIPESTLGDWVLQFGDLHRGWRRTRMRMNPAERCGVLFWRRIETEAGRKGDDPGKVQSCGKDTLWGKVKQVLEDAVQVQTRVLAASSTGPP